ncbi:MAG TPA: DUF58 domain-containing protein [Candidatus Angelobacter sp.]|nr:DUF58 domain-containing protein [Candidatus Angelobacter sp.]
MANQSGSLNPLKAALAGIDREAWLRFFLALAGLALAFAAAIFSAAASESGNVLATVIFASVALLLSGLVGILAIPYLFRRVAAERVRAALHFELTREGTAYLVVTLVIVIAALNTGNNLLFIVLAAMLSAIAVSGAASAADLRGLELDVALPQNAFAGRPVSVRVRLENPRRWIPAFSISVKTPQQKKKKAGWEWQKTRFIFPKRRQWFKVPDYTLRRKMLPPPPPKILADPVYFTFIPVGSSASAEVELSFPRRGQYAQQGFSLSTRFPFSFLTKSRMVELESELLVYPAMIEQEDLLDVLPRITGDFISYMRGRGTDLYRIREYTSDDMVRHIDWKASAKTGRLKVREFTREDERRLRLVFDNPEPGKVSAEAYERGVSLAATLACHFAGENVDLAFDGADYDEGPHLDDFLRYLALIQPRPSEWVLETMPVSSDFNVIVTSRRPGSIPNSIWECSYVIYM